MLNKEEHPIKKFEPLINAFLIAITAFNVYLQYQDGNTEAMLGWTMACLWLCAYLHTHHQYMKHIERNLKFLEEIRALQLKKLEEVVLKKEDL